DGLGTLEVLGQSEQEAHDSPLPPGHSFHAGVGQKPKRLREVTEGGGWAVLRVCEAAWSPTRGRVCRQPPDCAASSSRAGWTCPCRGEGPRRLVSTRWRASVPMTYPWLDWSRAT